MSTTLNDCQSAPECQLSETGTTGSYNILLKSTQKLSDDELFALEDDLSYYAKTGLIGVNMSRLLVMLKPENANAAA